jgi:hypothetical protein
MIILNLGPYCFSGIYSNLYVQREMESHKIQKDHHVIKTSFQWKEVVNKVTVYGLWFNYGLIPWGKM